MGDIFKIRKEEYDKIKDYPLFFFYKKHETVGYSFLPENNSIQGRILTIMPSANRNTILTYGKYSNQYDDESSKQTIIELELSLFDFCNYNHVKALFLQYLQKASEPYNQFAFKEILWALYTEVINIKTIENVISSFDSTAVQPLLWNALKNLMKFLSISRQRTIKDLLYRHGIIVDIYAPSILYNALKILYPQNIDFSKNGLFTLVNITTFAKGYFDYQPAKASANEINNNIILQIREWCNDSGYIIKDFNKIIPFFSLFSTKSQLTIIKRYFYAIWKNQLKFNPEVLEKIKEQCFSFNNIANHCALAPANPIEIKIPLICNSILTYITSQHTSLIGLNGVLDLAIKRCDPSCPAIDFSLWDILPFCSEGIVYNKYKFEGFLNYSVIYTFRDFSSISTLNSLLERILNILGNKLHTNSQSESNDESAKTNKDNKSNLWRVRIDDSMKSFREFILQFLELFVSIERIISNDGNKSHSENDVFDDYSYQDKHNNYLEYNVKMKEIVDIHSFKNDLTNLFNRYFGVKKFTIGNNSKQKNLNSQHEFILSKASHYKLKSIFDILMEPCWLEFTIRKGTYIGKDLFNNTDRNNNSSEIREFNNEKKDVKNIYEARDLEHKFIEENIKELLQSQLGVKHNEDGIFKIPYDAKILLLIKSQFYISDIVKKSNNAQNDTLAFLSKVPSGAICAPRYEKEINKITQMPYCWCRCRECFRTSVKRTSDTCWEKYTILNFLEILGFSQIVDNNGFLTISDNIRRFISVIYNAKSIFSHAMCRECRHVLFPKGVGTYGDFHYFQCKLPQCKAYNTTVYITRCYSCKKGIIDSRDSKACPNGLTICPECLSCCSDSMFENQTKKYINRKVPIPTWLTKKLGKGHNDKNQYFCPKCGRLTEAVENKYDKSIVYRCNNCNITYKRETDEW